MAKIEGIIPNEELLGLIRSGCPMYNLSGVEDIDVVAILGNLLDNALAAAERSAEKCMSLETTWRNSYGVIVITHSCDEAPPSSGERLFSTKEEPKLHGFGLKSVQRTLKK